MSRHWLISFGVLCAANAGCLLSEPINEPPTVGPIVGPATISRKSTQRFSVEADTSTLEWGDFSGMCPVDLAAQPRTILGAPKLYNAPSFPVTAETLGPLCVWVVARDRQGAETLVWKDVQVTNEPPMAKVLIAGATLGATPTFPLYQEIQIIGSASDADNDALKSFTWTVTLPSGELLPPTPCAVPADGSVLCLQPPAPGKYVVNLVVKDAQDTGSTTASTTLEVRPDQLPCVRDTETPGTPTILRRWDEDVAFTVAVDDDGDPFPPRELKPSKVDFVWLLRKKQAGSPAAMVRVTDYNQASFRLPAQSFVQGDEIEVRVEVMDRTAVPVMCADTEASCLKPSANAPAAPASTTAGPGQCSQRLTWTVRYVL